jgi:DNA-binding MarR family transcriptional regulator
MDRTSVFVWMRLMRVFQKIERLLAQQLRTHDLTLPQFDVLAHVGAEEGMTQQQLADKLLVTKGNICQLLDRMEENDMIIRRNSGRMNRIYLTDRGRALRDAVIPEHEQTVMEQFTVLDLSERRELLEMLRHIDRSLPNSSQASAAKTDYLNKIEWLAKQQINVPKE